jgi:uncharacterized glyoxalase superfamily protein PhnB
MVEYEGRRYPTVCPYLYYEDCATALKWLENAFGFTERMRSTDDAGAIRHCEMTFGDAVLMMGTPEHFTAPVDRITVGLYVHVDDVDAHYARAVAAGANVQGSPEDMAYGVRHYGVLDLAGHQWWFAMPLPV